MSMYLKLGTQDLAGKVYDDIKFAGGFFDIKQDGATSLRTGARKGDPKGFSASFFVCFETEALASAFLAYVAPYSPEDPDFDEEVGAETTLYLRTSDWYYRVWGVVVKPTAIGKSPLDYTQYMYDVTCYLYSPYSYARRPSTWLQSGITSLPVTKSISNRNGHIASAFESLAITCTYNAAHVKNLIHSIGSTSLTICDEALSNEIWILYGNENKITEEYNAAFTSLAVMQQDAAGSFTKGEGDWMNMSGGQYATWKLSGPNPLRYPVKMTADLHFLGGLPVVRISSDNVSYEEVIATTEFGTGIPLEYVLQGTEYMTDCYVQFWCPSGASMACGYLKFECERWVEYGAVPQIAAGSIGTATVDATTGSEYCNISGDFYTRRKFL